MRSPPARVCIVDDRLRDVLGQECRAHVVEPWVLDHELDAESFPRLAAMLQHDGELGEEAAHVVDRQRMLVTSRHRRARDTDVEPDRYSQLGALRVDGVVARVVVRDLGLQREHADEPAVLVADQVLHEPHRGHALPRIDNGRVGKPIGMRGNSFPHPVDVVSAPVARAKDSLRDTGLVHLVDELPERRAPCDSLPHVREQVSDLRCPRGRESGVRVDPGVDGAILEAERVHASTMLASGITASARPVLLSAAVSTE